MTVVVTQARDKEDLNKENGRKKSGEFSNQFSGLDAWVGDGAIHWYEKGMVFEWKCDEFNYRHAEL